MNSVEVGKVTELQVASHLLQAGFDVWLPMTDRHRSDMGVYRSGRLVRVQIKTGSFDRRANRYRAVLKTRGKRGEHLPYKVGEFEFFIVKPWQIESYYVISAAMGIRFGTVNMYPHRDRLVNRKNNVEWCRDRFDLLGA